MHDSSLYITGTQMTTNNKNSATADMGDHAREVGQKVGGKGCCTKWHPHPPSRLATIDSGILINPTIWPQHTNVTDRQDRQTAHRSDSTGRIVLQTVAQK